VELEQFSLQRAYQHAYKPSADECITILNIGAEVTNMVVVKDGLPSFNRDLSIGGSRFIEALQRSLGLEYEIALGVLKGNIPDGVSTEEVRNSIGRVIEELSTGIRRSFITYQASGDNSRIDRMYISGGCSLMPGLATVLSEQHGLPVEHFQPFQNISVPESVISDLDRDSLGAILSVATGLALRGIETGIIDIDILEQPEGKKKAGKKKSAAPQKKGSPALTVLCVVPYLGLLAGGFIAYQDYQDLKVEEQEVNAQIEETDAQISQLGIQVEQQTVAQDLQTAVNRRQDQILSLSLNQKYTVYVLEYLCRALYPDPATGATTDGDEKGIYLQNLIFSREGLAISGVAKTWGDIVDFQRRLIEIKPDGEHSLFFLADHGQTYSRSAEENITGTNRYNFEMTIGVNPSVLAPLVSEFAGVTVDYVDSRGGGRHGEHAGEASAEAGEESR